MAFPPRAKADGVATLSYYFHAKEAAKLTEKNILDKEENEIKKLLSHFLTKEESEQQLDKIFILINQRIASEERSLSLDFEQINYQNYLKLMNEYKYKVSLVKQDVVHHSFSCDASSLTDTYNIEIKVQW